MNRVGVVAVIIALASTPCLNAAAASQAALVAPPGFSAPVRSSDKDPRDCPTQATPYTATLDFPSKYEGSDKARDDLNVKAEKEYKARTAPITALEKGLNQQVEDYLRSGRPEPLACAQDLLRRWSSANALMGVSTTHTGKSMRKWALGSVASTYLRLKFSTSRPMDADPALSRQVDAWLGRIADRVVEEWSGQPLEKVNNHEYWAAWSVMATAVALNRRDLFEWSTRQFDRASEQVDAKGYLPNELKRDTRALSYHNYALAPLAMMAAFLKVNGEAIGSDRGAALSRLAERVMTGVEDPATFEQETGKEQKIDDLEKPSKFAWMEPYCWTFACTPELLSRMSATRPLKNYRLGGNLSDLFHSEAATAKRRSDSAHDHVGRPSNS